MLTCGADPRVGSAYVPPVPMVISTPSHARSREGRFETFTSKLLAHQQHSWTLSFDGSLGDFLLSCRARERKSSERQLTQYIPKGTRAHNIRLYSHLSPTHHRLRSRPTTGGVTRASSPAHTRRPPHGMLAPQSLRVPIAMAIGPMMPVGAPIGVAIGRHVLAHRLGLGRGGGGLRAAVAHRVEEDLGTLLDEGRRQL